MISFCCQCKKKLVSHQRFSKDYSEADVYLKINGNDLILTIPCCPRCVSRETFDFTKNFLVSLGFKAKDIVSDQKVLARRDLKASMLRAQENKCAQCSVEFDNENCVMVYSHNRYYCHNCTTKGVSDESN